MKLLWKINKHVNGFLVCVNFVLTVLFLILNQPYDALRQLFMLVVALFGIWFSNQRLKEYEEEKNG